LGELAKPATVLIEKISDALGGFAKPWQIKRIAQAEAVAKRIGAEADLEIFELQQRTFRRIASEEQQRQKNIESITEKSLPQLQSGTDPSKMDNDWIADFFERCRIVSDEDMQTLWSKILAGEANQPGSYSKRTLAVMSLLSKDEAEMFGLYGSFLWRSANGARYSIDSDVSSKFWPSKTVPFNVAQAHLHDIGLVGPIGTMSCSWSGLPEREFTYFDESYRFKFGAEYRKPLLEPVFPPFTYLTGTGYQLLKIAEIKKNLTYAEAVMQQLVKDYAKYHLEFERVAVPEPLNKVN